jgi:hypothetical protein
LDYLILPCRACRVLPGTNPELSLARAGKEAGRSWRGLLLGLTPLVSEPSWPPYAA